MFEIFTITKVIFGIEKPQRNDPTLLRQVWSALPVNPLVSKDADRQKVGFDSTSLQPIQSVEKDVTGTSVGIGVEQIHST
jgi:hypothetical protein